MILMDILARIGAERSIDMLYQLIMSLYAGWWILILIAIGGLALFWAEPRREFLEKIEKGAKLTVLRGGGDRLSFIERMNRALISGLGLGPTGELLRDYLPRPEDRAMREKVAEIRRQHHPKGVLLSAPPAAGKTRSALELIADIDPALVVVWQRGYKLENHPALPVWKGEAVILADDLALGANQDEPGLPFFLSHLAGRCARGLIIATAREERTPREVRELAVYHLPIVSKKEVLPLAQAVARHESERLGKKVSIETILRRWNGHPGSLVAGFDAMRALYEELPPEPRAFLQTLRQMWQAGVRSLSLERAWACYGDLWENKPDNLAQNEILRNLEKKGFISRKEDHQISVYEGYLDEVISLPENLPDAEQRLWRGFEERGDGQAFQEIGDAWSQEHSPAYQSNPQACLSKAIEAYERALIYRTAERAPLDYAMTKNYIGNAYARLAGYQEPVENLGKAIAAYERALVYRTAEHSPLDYAATQNNLGSAYLKLAEHRDPEANLKRAIAAYEKALVYRTPERAPLDYAGTQNNLGLAYALLAEQREPVENLGKAIAAYRRALVYRTAERAPLDYAMTQNNLGNAYADLAWYQEPAENLGKAIAAYEQALEHYTAKTTPLHHAQTVKNLARAHRDRAWHFIQQGELDLAQKDCARAEELDPENPYTHGRWGQLHHARQEYAQAVERYRKAAALHDDPTEFNFDLALPLLCLGQVEEAVAAIRGRLAAHACPSDLESMLPDFEKLAEEQPDLEGVEAALVLLREARERCREEAE